MKNNIERMNYDAMGCKSKTMDDRLFAVRTILWGLPSGMQVNSVPILEVGDYDFPFICQLPMINFPPTFQHHLITTSFHLLVCVDKGDRQQPIMSKMVPVYFQPIISLDHTAAEETVKLTNSVSVLVSTPRLGFNIVDTHQSIPVTVKLISKKMNEITLHVCLKRTYNINYKTFSRRETMVIAERSEEWCSGTTIGLDIPPLLFPTLTYSPYLSIEYNLTVTAKVRHGPIHVKKKILDIPVRFGTVPVGAVIPTQLEPYSAIVNNNSQFECKPHFIRAESRQLEDVEFLPPYSDEDLPPTYT